MKNVDYTFSLALKNAECSILTPMKLNRYPFKITNEQAIIRQGSLDGVT